MIDSLYPTTNKMKTYNVRLLIGNFREPFIKKHSPKHEWIEEMITAKYLSIGDNYYHFETDEGKHCYYPINYTIVTEI